MIIPHSSAHKQIPELNRSIASLKGIGPKRAELLARKGLSTILDLLFFMPVRYEDRRHIRPINKTEDGLSALVRGKVVSGREEKFLRSRKRLFRIVIQDETGRLELLWFHYRKVHLSSFARQGLEILAYGRVRNNKGRNQMSHPDIILMDHEKKNSRLGFYPVYPAVEGISVRILRSAVKQALDLYHERLLDEIPGDITRDMGLPGLGESIRYVHFPPEGLSIDLLNQQKTQYHKRLLFDCFFRMMLNITFRRRLRYKRTGMILSIPEDLFSSFRNFFPFSLTQDQVKSVKEIVKDLKSGRPMSRLLQGDVGCGKTLIAAVASYITIHNNYQVAVMVPTQVLAQQHYEYFLSLSQSMGIRPVLLTGALKKSDRINAYKKIKNGDDNLIIGTQALIQGGLSFSRLGLAVIDEQHRFGVRQRALLDKKGVNPHLLIMTATPIPRTLAMTVYADMDISVIKEYPAGHQPVITRLMDDSQKREVYETVKQKMSAGQQALVICPVIEGSEDMDLKNALEMYSGLKKLFSPRFRVGLIHGRLSPDEKDRIMDTFREGRIDLLVGTTVIEVGVHAPGATVIVIEHPERFGLSQLHQLRGRVGRGSKRGICLLMSSDKLPEDTLSRLKVLVETNDGFEIAQKDLEMRGQGELIGVRQAGPGEMDFEEMFREPELLIAAKREAEKVLSSDPGLSLPENQLLGNIVQAESPNMLDL